MDRSKKLLYGGVAAVVVIVLVAIVAWPRHSQMVKTCAPSADKPDVKTIKVENVASEDGSVVANLAGYVELVGENGNSYLPVDVDSVKTQTDAGTATTILTLSGDCMTFDVTFMVTSTDKINGTAKYNSYTSLEMKLRKENAKEAEKICEFSQPFIFVQPIDMRYSCQKEQSHKCATTSDKDKTVANLVLESFEMESWRDKDAKKGTFVKKPWPGSCNVWNL